jgi:AcrR family transcriptional regulator
VGQAADAVGAVSRRDRVRAATIEEIKQVARKILVDEGPEAVTLRAIARDMGMTAPALYRYFGSHQELIRNVIGDIFLEIADDIQAAIDAAVAGGLTAKFGAAAREFRRWSLGHLREFGLLFGTPLPGLDLKQIDVADQCGRKFTDTFLGLFLELWLERPFAVRSPEDIDPGLRSQLERYREAVGATTLPIGAILSFVYCWTRLYGMVSLEVFGHLSWILDDGEPMFELMLKEIMPVLGLDDPAEGPGSTRRASTGPQPHRGQ